ncbi:pilus assembly protein [Nakamurella sp. YIM 132087]|uniref:Pilus assembly protein n=1 Tax=Nakamurella alba TaxID=2665158 RepID=A0A7K1FSC0_9ACTN|nr:TadE family type IV pilus minor pilin [Nakamurella alba]MTD17035.1 pilus assembly protein [Nakamurella alba]
MTATPAGRSRRADRGGVTVEAALALSSLMVVLVLCLAGLMTVIAQLRISDAAAEAARLAGRGDESGAQAAVAALAPSGASLELGVDGDLVVAVVRASPGSVLSGIRLDARAVAHREESIGG